jgi:PAS domain S-box-containing protein
MGDAGNSDESGRADDRSRENGGRATADPELYEQLVEDSATITAVVWTDGRVTYVNPTVERVLGYDPDEVSGERLARYVHTEDAEKLRATVETLRDGSTDTEVVEIRFRHADGSVRWLRVTLRDRLDSDVVGGIVVSAQDVTERVEREELLRSRNEQLVEFAQVVSHDLRNPLNVAQARTRLLAEEIDSEHLAPTRRALDRMENIVEDTLTLAKQGKRVAETETVVVADLVADCWESVTTGDATLDLASEFTVRADPDRLRHVFENVFRNAIEHGEGSPTVSIGRLDPFYTSTREVERPDGFYVEDDGPGIPESERTAVFDPGHTSDPEGTGFGLAIVKRIAEAHGWTVEVLDGTSGGARFEFTGVTFVDS